ncbi:hypothetical protein, partial [Helicobacter sp. 23-1045]
MTKYLQILRISLFFIIFSQNLNAVELSTLCPNGNCEIKSPQSEVTNHKHFTGLIKIGAKIDLFLNYASIMVTASNQQVFEFLENGEITHFVNYGTIDTSKMSFYVPKGSGVSEITNYGEIGIIKSHIHSTLTINNFGRVANGSSGENIHAKGSVFIKNYALMIEKKASAFNAFTKYTKMQEDFAHLVVDLNNSGNISFADKNSKIILDFGGDFEFGSGYLLEKLVVDTSGTNKLPVDISRLTAKDDIFEISQSGKHFIITPKPQNTLISATFRANLRTMNNFSLLLNSQIYPRNHNFPPPLRRGIKGVGETPQKRTIRRIKKVSSLRGAESNAQFPSLRDSALADSWQSTNANEYANLKQNETFFYKNAESNAKNRRISRTLRTSNPADSANRPKIAESTADSAKNYHFIFTPFVNHNSFAKAGNYALSGFDYGFI